VFEITQDAINSVTIRRKPRITESKVGESVKQMLLRVVPGLAEEDFDTHERDLYVLDRPGVKAALDENYEFARNARRELSAVKGQGWYGEHFWNIPFANEEGWKR
jgi:hypothetical protein